MSFWFSSICRNFGLLGTEYKYCASLILIPLSWDVPNLGPEKRVRVHALPLSVKSSKLFRKISQTVVRISIVIPLFIFSFGVFDSDLHQSSGASSLLRSGAGIVDKSCSADVDDELLPELADNHGTTRGTKLSVLHTIVFPSLVFAEFSKR